MHVLALLAAVLLTPTAGTKKACPPHGEQTYQRYVRRHLRHGRFLHRDEQHQIVVLDGCLTRRQRATEHHWFSRYWAAQHDAELPMQNAVASEYGNNDGQLGGPLGCPGRGSYTADLQGVANKTMACGTRLHICYHGCTDVTVMDRGPYVAGREFDLMIAPARAIGFDGVGTIRYRRLG